MLSAPSPDNEFVSMALQKKKQHKCCVHHLDLLLLSSVTGYHGWPIRGRPLRQVAHGVGLPHKQVLAVVSLQHELGEAHTSLWVAVEHDGGRGHPGRLTAALWVRRQHHVQVSPWRTERATTYEDNGIVRNGIYLVFVLLKCNIFTFFYWFILLRLKGRTSGTSCWTFILRFLPIREFKFDIFPLPNIFWEAICYFHCCISLLYLFFFISCYVQSLDMTFGMESDLYAFINNFNKLLSNALWPLNKELFKWWRTWRNQNKSLLFSSCRVSSENS